MYFFFINKIDQRLENKWWQRIRHDGNATELTQPHRSLPKASIHTCWNSFAKDSIHKCWNSLAISVGIPCPLQGIIQGRNIYILLIYIYIGFFVVNDLYTPLPLKRADGKIFFSIRFRRFYNNKKMQRNFFL